jgi:hypothetical protein
MAVHRVVAQIGFTPQVPVGKGRVSVVANLGGRLVPINQLGLLTPKTVSVVQGPAVKRFVIAHSVSPLWVLLI